MIFYESFLDALNFAFLWLSPLHNSPSQTPFRGEVNVTTQWTLSDTYVGSTFFSGFDHEAISDPTHGRVKSFGLSFSVRCPCAYVLKLLTSYVNQATAQSLNLSYASGDTFILRADSKTTLSSGTSGLGRNSVRLQSKKTWGASTVVLDLRHMPRGCGYVAILS